MRAALLFTLLAVSSPNQLQNSEPSRDAIETWIDELAGPGETEARARLVENVASAAPRMETRFTELAASANRESFPQLIAIMRTFRSMGPGAAGSLPFLTTALERIGGPEWDEWKATDREATVASRNAFWDEMTRAIGSTGREGLSKLMDGARSGETTDRGVPLEHILWCIFPNGDDSLRTVVDFAFDPDPFTSRWGRNLVSHAEDGVGEVLERRLEDESSEVRRRAMRLLGLTLPYGVPAVSRALSHPDLELRRLAVLVLAANSNTHLLDPDETEYRHYVEWHGRLHEDETRPFLTLEALASVETQGSLLGALADPDEELRAMAAFTLYRVGAGDLASSTALEQAALDRSPAVSFWARRALDRRASPPTRWLEALSSLPHSADVGAGRAEQLAAAFLSDAESLASTPEEGDVVSERFEAVVQLARTRLTTLVEEQAGAVLQLMERERARHCATLFRRQREEYGSGVATDELRRIGAAALPELIAAYMQEPRFPVGPPTYEDYDTIIEPLGKAALPLQGEALFHWRPEAREMAEVALSRSGSEALALLPILIASWRLPPEDELEQTTLLKSRDWRACAAVAMGAATLPTLERHLDDAPVVSYAAARCILELEPGSPELEARARGIVEEFER